MSIEEQKFNCNCNDCFYLIRNFVRKQEWEDRSYNWQKESFDRKRLKLIKKADEEFLKGVRGKTTLDEAMKKRKALLKEANKMVFQYQKSIRPIFYGFCSLEGVNDEDLKPISFLPNLVQLHTQHCFKHRKDEE